MGIVLSTREIVKVYNNIKVNNKINMEIQEGEIYALIGKNGAGKTTFMEIVSGLLQPTEGTFSLWDSEQSDKFPFRYNMKVGALIENAGLIMNISGYDNIKAKCICVGKNNPEYIMNLLKMVSLENEEGKKVKKYSLGMKQRLGIALALVGDPDFLILDEPTNGLDPEGIAYIRNLLVELKNKGKTILISSHILEELAKIATRYAFMNKGMVIEEISNEDLKNKCSIKNISLEDYYFSVIDNLAKMNINTNVVEKKDGLI